MINFLRSTYKKYKVQRETERRIKRYADIITKQCAYEKMRYGHVVTGFDWFVGSIPHDWMPRINEKIKKIKEEDAAKR